MPGVGEQQHRRAVGQRRHQPGQPRLLHRLVEGDDPAGEGDAEVGGEPVQPAGVLDGEHVGRRHHLAQPRARRRRAARGARHRAPAVRSRRGACHGRRTGPSTYPGGMAVLAPERAEEEHRTAPTPAARAAGRSRARGATAPRRCPTTAGCPGC